MMSRGRTPSLVIANIVLRKVVTRRFSRLRCLEGHPEIFDCPFDSFCAIGIYGANLVLSNIPTYVLFTFLGIEMLARFACFKVYMLVDDRQGMRETSNAFNTHRSVV